MALYAYDDEILVYASDAKERRSYRCSHCKEPVKVRKGLYRIAHFYHLSRSPTCRLHSKSQDHLLAQLAIQSLLPVGEGSLEKSFFEILRVADIVWEPHKIIFEIQCSLLSQTEAEERVRDYAQIGYQIVWILDDRVFNKKSPRPAEQWIRQRLSYFASIRHQTFPIFYDQFEIFQQQRRIKKGPPLKVKLQNPRQIPPISLPEEKFPCQVLHKAQMTHLFFQGDLMHKAILSLAIPSLAVSMQNLRMQEDISSLPMFKLKSTRNWIFWTFLQPLGFLLLALFEKFSS